MKVKKKSTPKARSTFSERTDKLADILGTSLEKVAERLGFSRAMFFGYRSGKHAPSRKALAKLARGEAAVGPDDRRRNAREPEGRAPSFAARLRAVMKSKKMTQMALAVQVPISQSSISAWLSGKSVPQPRTVRDLAGALGVSPCWLIYGQRSGSEPETPAAATTVCAHDFYPA